MARPAPVIEVTNVYGTTHNYVEAKAKMEDQVNKVFDGFNFEIDNITVISDGDEQETTAEVKLPGMPPDFEPSKQFSRKLMTQFYTHEVQ